jgi:hypothetical protein
MLLDRFQDIQDLAEGCFNNTHQCIIDVRNPSDILHHTAEPGTVFFTFYTSLELDNTPIHLHRDVGTLLRSGILPYLGLYLCERGAGWSTGQVPESVDSPDCDAEPYDYDAELDYHY